MKHVMQQTKGLLSMIVDLKSNETKALTPELHQDFLEFCCAQQPSVLTDMYDMVRMFENFPAKTEVIEILVDFCSDYWLDMASQDSNEMFGINEIH